MRGPDFPWQQTREVVIQMVADLFKTARRRKEFSVEDPDLAALMLLGGLRSVIRLGQRPRSEDLARRIVNGFLGGVAMTSAKRPRIENPLSA